MESRHYQVALKMNTVEDAQMDPLQEALNNVLNKDLPTINAARDYFKSTYSLVTADEVIETLITGNIFCGHE